MGRWNKWINLSHVNCFDLGISILKFFGYLILNEYRLSQFVVLGDGFYGFWG